MMNFDQIFISSIEAVFLNKGDLDVLGTDLTKTIFEGVTKFWVENKKDIDYINTETNINLQNLNYTVLQLNENKTKLNIKKNDLENAQKELNDVLKQINTPLGTIPISVNSLISLFPLMGIVFVICAYLLSNLIRLRKFLHNIGLKDKMLNDEKIVALLPVWCDPFCSRWNLLANFAILLIPLFIFLVSWLLITDSIVNDGKIILFNFLEDKSIYKWLLTGIYVLNIVFFIIGYWLIISQFLNYKRWKNNRNKS